MITAWIRRHRIALAARRARAYDRRAWDAGDPATRRRHVAARDYWRRERDQLIEDARKRGWL